MRNKSIDVYRVALMFGICLLHAVDQGGHKTVWAANALSWCVTGFVFISGWFGTRFSALKLLKLYGISLYCATAFVLAERWLTGGTAYGLGRIWNLTISQWYLNAYAVLMCFAPLLNEGIHSLAARWMHDRKETLLLMLPLVGCAFGWSFATTLPVLPRYIPLTPGLTAYSFLTLIGAYVAARFLKELENKGVRFVPKPWVLLALVALCLILAAIGFNDYNSPFALILAAATFYLIKNARLPNWLGSICVVLGPTMFSVYLIHSHSGMWPYLRLIEDKLLAYNMGLVPTYLLAATMVFSVCLMMDVPRRVVALMLGGVRYAR